MSHAPSNTVAVLVVAAASARAVGVNACPRVMLLLWQHAKLLAA
jgi:hypothetical protein